jgi:hypothetical protein
LGKNDFVGTLPPEIGNIATLEGLSLDNFPYITGTIPASYSSLPNIKDLCACLDIVRPDQMSTSNNNNIIFFGSARFSLCAEKVQVPQRECCDPRKKTLIICRVSF